MQGKFDGGQTKARGIYTWLMAAIGELNELLPHQTEEGKERLRTVLKALEPLKDLARCVSVQGDEDPAFKALFEDWRKSLREQRKKKFKNLELLAIRTGIHEGTLKLIETGHRVPGRQTLEALLKTKDLELDRHHLFVQVIINRSDQ